jgi:hypothetical protein
MIFTKKKLYLIETRFNFWLGIFGYLERTKRKSRQKLFTQFRRQEKFLSVQTKLFKQNKKIVTGRYKIIKKIVLGNFVLLTGENLTKFWRTSVYLEKGQQIFREAIFWIET